MRKPISKKTYKNMLLALVAISALVLGGCTTDNQAAGSNEDENLTIGLALYTQLQPRWQHDADAFVEQAEANGDEVIVQYADADPEKQTQQVESMLSQGIDVLVIASADIEVGGTLIERAKTEGVKTIAYDIGVSSGTADWTIVRNQEQVGQLQIEAAKEAFPTGNYALLAGDAANDLAQTSIKVYERELSDDSEINVVHQDFVSGFDPATAQRMAEDVLTRNNDDVDVFIANNDGIATGVVQALRSVRLNGETFVSGLDGDQTNLNLIATGDQSMTVYTPVDEMAIQAADAAHQLGRGQEPEFDDYQETDNGEVPTKYLDLIAVNQDNLCEFVTDIAPEGWADPEEVFAGSDITCE